MFIKLSVAVGAGLFIAVLWAIISPSPIKFTPPTPEERIKAIGLDEDLPKALRQALEPGEDFEGIPPPGPNDWLANHYEPRETFKDFVASAPNRPEGARRRLYLQPIGGFQAGKAPPLDLLRECAEAFFMMPVVMLDPLSIEGAKITTRVNPHTKNRQLLTRDVLTLLRKHLPPDAFALQAVTTEDLYPAPSWNFVFGQASLRERVGVLSFARYDPAFYGEKAAAEARALGLRRSCKLLVHESGHMFGMGHCVFFRCIMNGSNHLEESDSRGLRLCPVCLHKLQWNIGFETAGRYRRLRDFFKKAGFNDEVEWIVRRLAGLDKETGDAL